MKKFMKGCAVTAAVLLVLGFVMAFVAGAVKGTGAMAEAVERVTGGRVHLKLDPGEDNFGIWVGETVWEGIGNWGGLDMNINDSTIFDSGYDVMKGDVSRYALGTAVDSLEIEVAGCILTVKESEDDNFYVEAQNARKFQGYVENGTLHIKSVNNNVFGNSGISKHSIILYVPADYSCESIEISLGAGMLKFTDIRGEKVDLEIGAGQLEADSVETEKLAMEIGAGEVIIKNINVEELEAEIGMGNLEAEGSIGRKADLECGMGNIEMVLQGQESDFNYQIDAAMGNVDIGANSYSGLASERRVNNGAAKDLQVECSMGNISITFR